MVEPTHGVILTPSMAAKLWIENLGPVLAALAVHFAGLGYEIWPSDIAKPKHGFVIGRYMPGSDWPVAPNHDRWAEMSLRVSIRHADKADHVLITNWTQAAGDLHLDLNEHGVIERLEQFVLAVVGKPVQAGRQ